MVFEKMQGQSQLFLVLLVATLATSFSIESKPAETSQVQVRNSTEEAIKAQKHIDWFYELYGTTTTANYSTVCEESDLYHCFSEWDKSSVQFYLFNRGRNGSEILKIGDLEQLKKSPFKPKLPVKFIIHGYKQNAFSQFCHLIREGYLEHGNETNVIVVEWQWLASDAIYFNAAFNTRIVGERVGEFIIYLRKAKYLRSYKSVHIVGFSLGAHVAGFAAKHVKKATRVKIARVTGLDPAGPSFLNSDKDSRLDATDAQFVDVIHTSVGASGIVESIGHVDFYPNGGEEQPGCEWERIQSFFLKNCSHERAYEFFLATIRGEKFVGCGCPNWAEFNSGTCRCNATTPGAEIMGESCSFQARGDKYLATTSDSHYLALH